MENNGQPEINEHWWMFQSVLNHRELIGPGNKFLAAETRKHLSGLENLSQRGEIVVLSSADLKLHIQILEVSGYSKINVY